MNQNIDWRVTKVAELIDQNKKEWNEDTLRELFTTDQVERILTIPIPSNQQEDLFVWNGDKEGVYTAKSGYIWKMKELQ